MRSTKIIRQLVAAGFDERQKERKRVRAVRKQTRVAKRILDAHREARRATAAIPGCDSEEHF